MKEKIDQFCKNYEIQIVDDQKRRARYHPPKYFTDPLRADIVSKEFIDYETEKVLILDADTVLLFNPFDSPNTFYYTREQNLPYYAMVEQLFGYRPVLEYSCIANFMVFCPSSLSSLVEEIEYRHKKTWPYAIISILNSNPLDFNFSEYETYSNWLAINSPPVTLRQLRIFRRGDLLLKSSNYLDVVRYLALKRYHCVAFEHTHSSSASKKIAARLISFFGLRAW